MNTLAPFAAAIAAKVALLLGVAALLVPLLRGRSAALRHLAWSLAVGGAVFLPMVAALSPLTLPVLPSRAPEATTAPVRELPTTGAASDDLPAIASHVESANAAGDVAAPLRLPALPTLLLAAWITGTLLMLGRFALGIRTVRAIVRRAVPLEDPRWVAIAERTRRDFPRGRVALRLSDDTDMPFATGLLAPTIVLPASAMEWSADRREAVLLHELAHLRRGDLLMNTLGQVARALHWFNPLAWYAAHRLRVEAECAADDAVLRKGARASDYADHLLSIATNGRTALPSAALAMARRSAFEGRLLAILAPHADRIPPSRARVAAVAALFALVLLPLAAVSPAAQASAVTPLQDARTLSVAPRVQQASSAVPALIEALGDENASVRLAAIQSLGSLEDPRAIAALGRALKEDSDPRVRQAAAEALGEIDDPRAVPHLVEALRTERVSGVRERIVHALGEIGDPVAVDAIAGASKDESVGVRRAVANALGELEARRALPTLIAMARDSDVEVRRHVADALGDLEDEDGFDPLMLLARDADAEVRQYAIRGIGELGGRRALDVLTAALKDPDADVRAQAAEALQHLDELRTAPPALLQALADPSANVRKHVAHALGDIEDEAAVPALRRALSDANVEVRRAVADALSEIGGAEAITALMGLLKDPDPEIRKTAAEALGKRR